MKDAIVKMKNIGNGVKEAGVKIRVRWVLLTDIEKKIKETLRSVDPLSLQPILYTLGFYGASIIYQKTIN